MQIDFHHAVTYVAARAAGFPHGEADIIAYSAQYVDDATTGGPIDFDNGAMYMRISSAHKTLDPRNLDNHENRQVWLPFHFLPGNGGLRAGEDPEGTFINKIVCTPDSPVAHDMLAVVIRNQDKPYGLHRLGIAMHVYADTWAHQGFAGVQHAINEVDGPKEIDGSNVIDPLQEFLGRIVERAAPALGHARAGSLPDLPFLSWQYRNGRGQEIVRDNTALFCDAADALCKAMQRFRLKSAAADVPGLGGADKEAVRDLLGGLKDMDGKKRHREWLGQIRSGRFSFGEATVAYDEARWKVEALAGGALASAARAGAGGGSITADLVLKTYPYSPSFLQSDWKLFHDALQLHRLIVLHDLLPKYGICSG